MIPFASWSVLTVDFLFVLHLSLSGVALSALLYLVNAKWRFQIRHIAVAFFALYPLAVVLLLVLLFGGATTFPWVGSFEKLPGWNNLTFLSIREVLGIVIVGLLYGTFVRLQPEAEKNADNLANYKRLAMAIPFVHVLYCTMVAWDFEMTLIPHWESAMFAVNYIVSVSGLFLSVFITVMYFLQRAGVTGRPIPGYVFNYVAQMMLGFTILWIYTFFAQYLIIWYGNIPEETGRLWGMQDGFYGPLFWTFFAMKFVIPFVNLALPHGRHYPKITVLIAIDIIIGTWIERYTWISGSYPTPHWPMTGLFDLVVTAAVLSAGWFLVRSRMRSTRVIHG